MYDLDVFHSCNYLQQRPSFLLTSPRQKLQQTPTDWQPNQHLLRG